MGAAVLMGPPGYKNMGCPGAAAGAAAELLTPWLLPLQVELAAILRFVLENEESLSENLELFLQRKGEHWPRPEPQPQQRGGTGEVSSCNGFNLPEGKLR